MKIGIIGSGQVAQTLGDKLLELGHEVMISSRNLEKEKDAGSWGKIPSPHQWVQGEAMHDRQAYDGSFDEAAAFGEVLINCTAGVASIDALSSCDLNNLNGKILIDLANLLDFSHGMPPTLAFCNTDSLGERIQKTFPNVKVVKTLNTVNANIMVNPSLVPGDHDLFIAGNDMDAKKWAKETLLMHWFSWKSVIDLGDITAARAMEMYLPLWLRLWGTLQTPNFNIKVVK